jgi:hypothetical protein
MNLQVNIKNIPIKNVIDKYDSETSLCIFSNDFLDSDSQLIKILESSINKKVSNIHLV